MRAMEWRGGLGVVIALTACASGPSHVPSPQETGARWGTALRDDRPEQAYELLDPRVRASVDHERFMRIWRENRPELAELGQRLRETDAKTVAQAQVQLDDGEQIGLVLERGQWRIAGGVLDAQALGTPLDAVAELRRALERQSLPALLRVLSRERRAAWVSAFEKTMEQTSDALDLRVEINQDDAIVHLTGGGEILLKREAGRWQVWDVR
jgi:predicted LPLAT superfamily acyltransferase